MGEFSGIGDQAIEPAVMAKITTQLMGVPKVSERLPDPKLVEAQKRADEVVRQRRAEAQRLIGEGRTLQEITGQFGNDYSALDELYAAKTGVELISDPDEASEHEIPIKKSCSIVIPFYNNTEQLRRTLHGIQASSFNHKYPQQLEVVVVDDGSPDADAAKFIEGMEGLDDLTVRVFRESNGRENKARYSGVLHATGDVVILTAQDVVYSPQMIEEYMKRHEVLDDIVCFGFRDQIKTDDARLAMDQIADGSLNSIPIDFAQDGRIVRGGMADCRWTKNSGNNMKLPIDAESDDWYVWTLQGTAWGLSVSASREALLRTRASYDERYTGFGGDDEQMISDLIADGNFVIPMTGGIIHHQQHGGRWDEAGAQHNQSVLRENLQSPPKRQDPANPHQTDAKLLYEKRNTRKSSKEQKNKPKRDEFRRGINLLQMGFYDKAVEAFSVAEHDKPDNYLLKINKALAQISSGGTQNIHESIAALESLREKFGTEASLHSALALAYGRDGDYTRCLQEYQAALKIDPENRDAVIIRSEVAIAPTKTADKLHEVGQRLLKRGKPLEALRYYEAAVALKEGGHNAPWSLFDKGVALSQLKHFEEAAQQLLDVRGLLPGNTWVDSRIGMVYEEWGKTEQARTYYTTALAMDNNNSEAIEGLNRLSITRKL